MIEAITNLLLVVLAVSAAALWIHGLVNSDGKCHFDNCRVCPYSGGCPWERRS